MRKFGPTIGELFKLADLLKSGGCEMAIMESTASYRKHLFNKKRVQFFADLLSNNLSEVASDTL